MKENPLIYKIGSLTLVQRQFYILGDFRNSYNLNAKIK